MFLSIVIPAFNEVDRLPLTLQTTLMYLKKENYISEIIIVDDGSTDATVDLIERDFAENIKVLRQISNCGKGAAVRKGILEAKGEQILYMDADGSTPIEELPKLQAELEKGVPIAIGSRHNNSLIGIKQPFYRIILGKFFNFLVCKLIGTNIQDTQCGFKLLKGNIAHELFKQMKIKGFSFDVELLYLAAKHRYKIAEVSVVWSNDARSKVNIWRDPIIMFWELLKIRFNQNNNH